MNRSVAVQSQVPSRGGGARSSGVYESVPPDGPGVAKVTPMRGGRYAQLNPRRRWARDVELDIFSRLFGPSDDEAKAADPGEMRVTDAELASAIGSPHANVGARVRCGGAPITPGECMLLLPLRVAGLAFVALFRERVGREIRDNGLPTRDPVQTNLRLIMTHLDAIDVLLSA